MRSRKTAIYAMMAILIMLVGLTPLAANASNPDQGGPTATPEDPVWLAFSATSSIRQIRRL